MESKSDLVQKLWGLCNVLRDDGITYHQYVNELTYLLFLKMSQETGTEDELPEGFRWLDLAERRGADQFDFYRKQLVKLGTEGTDRVKEIFANPTSLLRHAENLNTLVDRIDSLDWFSVRREGLGEIYEGLLERNASEKKSGAGQYFTPRPLIECMVAVMRPLEGETIQDPAAGTGGFIIVAGEYIKRQIHDGRSRARSKTRYQAIELVQDTYRLLLMNVALHGIDGDFKCADTLSSGGLGLASADLMLTNPPFGTKRGGGLEPRGDLTYPTSNKQLAFLQHVYEGLLPGGRAAVIVPDNVLFEDGIARQVRSDLMRKCKLHTILRLPTGIFYAQSVKTNVLFFRKNDKRDKGETEVTWIYDLRSNMTNFGKRTPLSRDNFTGFEHAYGADPHGTAARVDQGETGRFRRFTREQIRDRNENLDIAWLRDDRADGVDGELEPEEITARISERLRSAMIEIDALTSLLVGESGATSD